MMHNKNTTEVSFIGRVKMKYPKENKAGKDLKHRIKKVTPYENAPEGIINFEVFYVENGKQVTQTKFDPPLELEIDLSTEDYEFLYVYKDNLKVLEKKHISMFDISEEWNYTDLNNVNVRRYVTLQYSKLPDPNVGWGPS